MCSGSLIFLLFQNHKLMRAFRSGLTELSKKIAPMKDRVGVDAILALAAEARPGEFGLLNDV
jgi:hypothetical protein